MLAYDNVLKTDAPDGPIVRGLAHDVTELKRAEKELRARERQFRAVFEGALDAVLVIDDEGKLVQVNPAASDLLGLAADELVRRQAREFLIEYDSVFGSWEGFVNERGAKGEIGIRPATGPVRTVEYCATPSFLPGRHLAILRDVTDRRKMELAIQESNRFMGNVLEYSPAIIYVIGKDGRYRMVNQNWERIVGRSRDEIIGQRWEDIWPADIAGQWSRDDLAVIESAAPLAAEEHVDTPSGSRYLYTVRFPLVDQEGQVEAVSGISIDITDRKRAEHALAESEVRFRRTFEHAAVGMALTLADGRFLEVNQAFCDITGYTEDELLSINMLTLTHPDDHAACIAMIDELLARRTQSYQIEKRYIKKGGDIVWVRNSNSLISDGSGKPASIVTLTQDVTNWKLAEVALKDSEK
ncbi:MAG: PAS domain-containing protein, partial [Blastocatellia bacterium]